MFSHYLIHGKKRFIIFKTRGAVEGFIDMIKRDRSLNDFKHDPFHTHYVSLLAKEFSIFFCISRENWGKRFVKIYVCFITYKHFFTALISFVFCSWIIQ